MFLRMIDFSERFAPGLLVLGFVPLAFMGFSHADLIGWTGTILSVATAFTGGFVMIYQRIQRARRDDRVEWIKLRQGSLQALLDQTNRDLAEARDELAAMTAKLNAMTQQNTEQLTQIIELTRLVTRLGSLISRLPYQLGLRLLPATPSGPQGEPIAVLGVTVSCLEGIVDQLRETTHVLRKLATNGSGSKPEPEPEPELPSNPSRPNDDALQH